jgi:NADPH:quinone reductase-like Zn-dependent oxidoreductase
MKAITLNEFGSEHLILTELRGRPVIDSSYELTDAAKAIEALPHNSHFGKTVVSF